MSNINTQLMELERVEVSKPATQKNQEELSFEESSEDHGDSLSSDEVSSTDSDIEVNRKDANEEGEDKQGEEDTVEFEFEESTVPTKATANPAPALRRQLTTTISNVSTTPSNSRRSEEDLGTKRPKGGVVTETKSRFTPRIFKINSLKLAERGITFKKAHAVPYIYCLQMETYYRSVLQQVFRKRADSLVRKLARHAKIHKDKKTGRRTLRWSKVGITNGIHKLQRQKSITLNEMSFVLQTNKHLKPYVKHTMIPLGPKIRPGSQSLDPDSPSTMPCSQKQARELLFQQKKDCKANKPPKGT